jgi:predicted nucleic acid-binding protein
MARDEDEYRVQSNPTLPAKLPMLTQGEGSLKGGNEVKLRHENPDAFLLVYAEHYGLEEIVSEDFEHGRLYGRVRGKNPFRKG